MNEMLEAVRKLHDDYHFAENGGENMLFRMNLIMEEVGEICECLTKGYENIGEEHADLLILLLGNCIALGIDIEREFWLKLDRLKQAGSTRVNHHTRLLSHLQCESK